MNAPAAPDYPPPQGRPGARPMVIGSVICSVAALIILPIILGPIGAVLGFVGYSRGDRKGLWAGIFGIVATVAGMLIGAAVYHSMHR
jgi:hypothetical protein